MSIFFHFPPLALDPPSPIGRFSQHRFGNHRFGPTPTPLNKDSDLICSTKKMLVSIGGVQCRSIAFVNWLLNALCVLVSMYYSHYQPYWVQIRSTSEKGFRAMPRLPRRYISRCLQACPPKYFTTMAAMQNCKNVAQILHTLFTYFKMLTGLSAKIFHNSGYDAKLQKKMHKCPTKCTLSQSKTLKGLSAKIFHNCAPLAASIG